MEEEGSERGESIECIEIAAFDLLKGKMEKVAADRLHKLMHPLD